MVDISGCDVTHFDNVDKALGLTRSNELTYESICDKVKPIDEARDKKMMESGFIEAFTEILARAEAEASWPKQCPLVKRCTILRRARSVSNVTNTTINPCSSVQAGRFLRLRPTSSH